MAEALCCKPGDRGFESRLGQFFSSIYLILPAATWPLTKMSTRNLHGGKERPAGKANNLTAICEPTV
jgi:hypothetical protein